MLSSIGDLREYIQIYRRYDSMQPMDGGESDNEFMYIMDLMCKWKNLKPTELVDGVEPVKYIQNVQIIIPYNEIITVNDYFVVNDEGKYFKISHILPQDSNKMFLTLFLTEYTRGM